MSSSEHDKHLKYIKNYLIKEIISNIKTETLVNYETEHSGGLDGFMSALYTIKLTTNAAAEQRTERLLIVKFMKGDTTFRETSKSYPQFANEVFIYNDVIPTFAKLLKAAKVNSPSVDDWVAPSYMAKFGYIEGLSASSNEQESVLVLENLKPYGYVLGPRVYLKPDHLVVMSRVLGQYHALSHALRFNDEAEYERLKSKIIPLPFINDDDPNDAKHNLYRILYRQGFDRLYEYFDRKVISDVFNKSDENDLKLIERMRYLREKYYEEPTRLLERLRRKVDESEEDRHFAVILHGDYNRNNVLFRYKNRKEKHDQGGDEEEVEDLKMIDFQELRYGSPAIDLSFFMFMNMSDLTRSKMWTDILKEYHGNMYQTLSNVLKSGLENDSRRIEEYLKKYSFENFNSHFARFALYGVIICVSFLPWMLCSEEECSRISTLFETDIHSEEFRKLNIEAGGDEVNLVILNILRHACKMGYMDHL